MFLLAHYLSVRGGKDWKGKGAVELDIHPYSSNFCLVNLLGHLMRLTDQECFPSFIVGMVALSRMIPCHSFTSLSASLLLHVS